MKFETLERRRLFSVTVVQGYPGFYEVYGDESDDVIQVSFSGDGTFTVEGDTYGDVAYVSIFGNGGDDIIDVGPAPWPVGVSANGGHGNDTITLNSAGGIWGDEGNDIIHLNNSFRGTVFGGSGDDRIYLAGDCIEARVDGEEGSDFIDGSGNNYGIFAHGGKGEDTVYGSNYDDEIYGDAGNDLLFGAAGNDVAYAVDQQGDRVIGGAGIDTAFVDAAEAGVWGIEYVYYPSIV